MNISAKCEKNIVHEDAQVFNSVCDPYGITRTSSGKGYLKWRSPSNSDVVAFGGIDMEVRIYRPIPGIAEGALQKFSL